MPRLNEEQKNFRQNVLVPFLEKYTASNFFADKNLLSQFCSIFGCELEDVLNKNKPKYKWLFRYLNNIKDYDKGRVKKTKKKVLKNSIIVEKVKTHKKIKKTLNEANLPTEKNCQIEIIEEQETKSEFRFIKKIQFASLTTKETASKIEKQITLYNELVKDYYYYLSGGEEEIEVVYKEVIQENQKVLQKIERPRHAFPSIKLGKIFQKQLSKALKDGTLSSIDQEHLANIEKQLKLLERIERAPIYFMNSIAEGGFNIQKELQGAILNDKGLIETGIVVLESETKNVDENIPNSIKEVFARTEKKVFGELEK